MYRDEKPENSSTFSSRVSEYKSEWRTFVAAVAILHFFYIYFSDSQLGEIIAYLLVLCLLGISLVLEKFIFSN